MSELAHQLVLDVAPLKSEPAGSVLQSAGVLILRLGSVRRAIPQTVTEVIRPLERDALGCGQVRLPEDGR